MIDYEIVDKEGMFIRLCLLKALADLKINRYLTHYPNDHPRIKLQSYFLAYGRKLALRIAKVVRENG